MSLDHASGVTAPGADPVFLHVRAGMTVIVEDGSDWRMADVIWVDGGARNPKVPTINGAEIKPTMDADGVLLHEGQQVAEPSEMTMFPHTSLPGTD